jgi:tetratricopeptide (TPR) repeat protein
LGRSAFDSVDSAGPLVGRGVELGVLHATLAEVVSSGRPRLVVFVAEAGLGKSRLLVEFEHALGEATDSTSRFTAKATSETTTMPYGLLRAVITERLGLADTDPLEVVQERLRSLAGIDEPLRAVRLGRLLGFEIATEGVDAKEVYEGGLGDLVSILEHAATGQAAVVLLEDVHWADEASLDVIDHLLGAVRGPMLVVASARPTIVERRSSWRDDGQATWMELAPLGSTEAGTLLGTLFPGGALSTAVADMVHEAAQGNPYYLGELARMLVDAGAVRLQRGTYVLDRERLEQVGVPATLTGVLHARIDAVPGGQRDVLDRAAVVGRTFWDKAVEHLVDPPTAADVDLAALADRSMVARRNRSQFGGTVEYDFDHGLLREATYQALLRRRRTTYHARAARWLEEVTAASGRSDEFSAQIARHHAEAGAGEDAAAWYLRAADRAAGQYANDEAVHFLDLAIALIPAEAPEELWGAVERRERLHGVIGLREAQGRDLELMTKIAEELDDNGWRAEAALRDADQAERMGEYERAIGDANRAMVWARADGDVEREVRSLRQLAAVRWRTGDLAGARRVIDEGLDLAKRNGLDEWEGRLLRNWGMVEEHLGDYNAAERHYQGALERARRRRDRREIALGLNDLGIAAYYLGDLLKALRLEEEALAMRVEMGDRVGEATVLNNLALTTGAIGDFTASRDLFSRTMGIAEDVGDAEGIAAAIQGLGVMTSRLGAIDEARSLLDDATRRYEDLGDTQGTSQCLEELGWTALASDRATEALIVADRAMELARDGGFSPEEANGRRLRGRVVAALGRHAEAVEELGRAASDQAAIGNEPAAVSARAWLAASLQALGDQAEAHSMAAESLTRLLALDGNGVDDPVGAYLACADVLAAAGDPRSEEALAAARRLVERRSALIKDDDERVRFQEFHRRRLP